MSEDNNISEAKMSAENSLDSNASSSCVNQVQRQSASCMETRVCVVGQKNIDNEELTKALEALKLTVITTEDTKDILNTLSDDIETVFVCDPFEGEDFINLHKEEQRIIGPPVVLACAKNNQSLPCNSRPLYCSTMANHIICFTGFKKKEEMGRLCNLVHHMGGSIRGELSGRVTHLVASSVHGHKYGAAVSLGKPIMTVEWIYTCWEKRFDLEISASSEEMDKFKMAPFHGLFLSFYGFSDEEKKHMEESTEQQAGKYVDSSDECCTHLVVEDSVKQLPSDITSSEKRYIVKQEWFWASIHMDGCADESLYPFTAVPRDQTMIRQKTSSSAGRKRKRKKIKESDISNLLSPDSPLFKNKRKSGDLLSVSGSLLDYTLLSPSTPGRGDGTPSGTITPLTTPKPPPTARQQVTIELLQTERNYVGILTTILKVFKEPLETDPRGPIVPAESIKTIFGSLPLILDVHTKIMGELERILSTWTETECIGKVILHHADVLCKVYPPFVNYFEMSKETVTRHDKEDPRFHAFLKACLSKSECGRQSLAELLIRPVQRLPSVKLLLSDILKKTDKNNPDYVTLMQAIDALKNVMMHINEDKRKTEGQVQMFEILRDVDGCPAYILSSHRSYVTKADTFELGDGLCGKGEPVTIFLFNDSLEMTKRRGIKMNRAMKSPAAARTPQKSYKHVEFIPLSHVRRVVDIRDNEDCQNLFGIIYRGANEMKEKLLMFRLISDDIKKDEWLHKLSSGLANTACTADTENFVTTVDPQELMISKSDFSTGTLSRAVRVAKRTTRKVSRALSMNKTPRKNSLRRSSSNVTPKGSVFASPTPLMPSSKYNQNLPLGARGRAMSVCEGLDSELVEVDVKVRRSMSISEER